MICQHIKGSVVTNASFILKSASSEPEKQFTEKLVDSIQGQNCRIAAVKREPRKEVCGLCCLALRRKASGAVQGPSSGSETPPAAGVCIPMLGDPCFRVL